MRIHGRTVLTVLGSMALFSLSSMTVRGQDALSKEEQDRLRDRDASSGGDAKHASTRQGDRHIRQGNASTGTDNLGRPYAPYAGENAQQILEEARDHFQLNQWGLDIELGEPQCMKVKGTDGNDEEVWYVLYKIINRNTQTVADHVMKVKSAGGPDGNPDGSKYDPKNGGFDKDGNPLPAAFLTPETGSSTVIGMPVSTTVGFFVETLTGYDALKGDADDLTPVITAELDKLAGTGLSDNAEGTASDNEWKARQLDARIAKAHRILSDSGDANILKQIAAKHNLREWRDGKYESVLWPTSSFQRDIASAYTFASHWLDGPRCLPVERSVIGADGKIGTVTLFPAIYTADNALAGFFAQGSELEEGTRLVTEATDTMWGKITLRRYREYDVVDRFGRPLSVDDAGYLAAKAAGGEVTRAKDGPKPTAENLSSLIGTLAKRPRYRYYMAGDRVLQNWDTGVVKPGETTETYKISGLLVTGSTAALYAAAKTEREANGRGAMAAKLVGADISRAAANDMFGASIELNGNTEVFPGRNAVGDNIPVKQIDHLGRAIRRGLVTYQTGETVTEAEYRIWAARFPASVVKAHDAQPWTRPLRSDDLLTGLPKIKMGRAVSEEHAASRETITRSLNGSKLPNYETGRGYDPRVIRATDFARDPDGTYYTHRAAPLPQGSQFGEGEAYVYAPLGAAKDGAVPVPSFDRYGVWADYVDAAGNRVPLTDASGQPVLDEENQPLFVKDYEYEWLYLYEFVTDDEAASSFGTKTGGTLNGYAHTDVEVFTRDDQVVGLKSWVIWKVDAATGGKTYVRRSLSADAGAGEVTETPEEQIAKDPALKVATVKMPNYVYDQIKAKFGERGASVDARAVALTDLTRTPEKTGDSGDGLIATSSRWTMPPPLVVIGADGKPVALTNLTLDIGADKKIHAGFISERWGAIILKGMDPAWDYMNINIRGLVSAYARDGRIDSPFTVSSGGADGQARAGFAPRWMREDWVYTARFSRSGDEKKNESSQVRTVSKGWKCKSRTEVPLTGAAGG